MTHGFSPGMTPLAFIDLIFTQISWGFPCGSDCKESACNAGHLGSIPGLGRSPEGGNGNPFQYSCLKNPKDRGAWEATVHWITKSRTHWATNFHFHIYTHSILYLHWPWRKMGCKFPTGMIYGWSESPGQWASWAVCPASALRSTFPFASLVQCRAAATTKWRILVSFLKWASKESQWLVLMRQAKRKAKRSKKRTALRQEIAV